MSRTDKDIPFFVMKQRDFEDGNIEHDHIPRKNTVRRNVNKDSIKEFSPDQKSKIAEYAQELRNIGKEPQIVETKQHRGFLFTDELYFSLMRRSNGLDSYSEDLYKNDFKIVVEVFYYDYVVYKARFSDKCTDAEHYDSHLQTDTRDGKIASCAPVYNYRDYHKCPKNKMSRAKVRQALKNVEKNLGNLDEYGAVAELNEEYDKKIYLDWLMFDEF